MSMKNKSEFVVFCEPRTGSYSLISRLHSAHDITCHEELFKEGELELYPWHRRKMKRWTAAKRNNSPDEFLSELRALNPHKAFGFKLFNQHVNRVKPLRSYLNKPSIKKVVLYRDPLEVYASLLRARKTNKWTKPISAKNEVEEAPKVRFTPESIMAFATSYNAFLENAFKISQSSESFAISYSHIEQESRVNALLNFLGSSASIEDVHSEYAKQYTGSLEEAFENWNELNDFINSTVVFRDMPAGEK